MASAGKLAGRRSSSTFALTSSAPNRASSPLPADAVSAVLNITVDEDATAKSFITVWPTGEARPNTSATNAEPGEVTPNLTFARLGTGGSVSFYNVAGATNLAVDLVGYTMPLTNAAAYNGDEGGVTANADHPRSDSVVRRQIPGRFHPDACGSRLPECPLWKTHTRRSRTFPAP